MPVIPEEDQVKINELWAEEARLSEQERLARCKVPIWIQKKSFNHGLNVQDTWIFLLGLAILPINMMTN